MKFNCIAFCRAEQIVQFNSFLCSLMWFDSRNTQRGLIRLSGKWAPFIQNQIPYLSCTRPAEYVISAVGIVFCASPIHSLSARLFTTNLAHAVSHLRVGFFFSHLSGNQAQASVSVLLHYE